MKYRSRFLSCRSLTLVEGLISLVLMTMGLLAAYLTYAQSIRLVNSMWNTSRVNSSIRQQMELIRTWDWDTQIKSYSSGSFSNEVLAVVPGAVGTIEAEYYPNSTNSASLVKKITVIVDWTDMNGVAREDSATTLICKDGLNTAGLQTQ